MSRTLVIPDTHLRWHVLQRTMESVEWDKCVHLGDHFDQFNEQMIDVEKSAELALELSRNPKVTLLTGNHDTGYNILFPVTRHLSCSGNSSQKRDLINKIMTPEAWAAFQTHAFVDDWVLSHAGFSPHLVGRGSPAEVMAEIDVQSAQCVQALRAGVYHMWLAVSRCRGGIQPYGGPFWQDFREFSPLSVNQLCGHTIADHVRYYESADGSVISCCIDTNNRCYAIIEDGVLTVHDTPASWLKRPAARGPKTRRLKLSQPLS